MMNSNSMICKPSAVVQINSIQLTLTQRKIINVLIHVVQSEVDNKIFYYIPIARLKSLCGISMEGNDYIKRQLKELAEIKIEFNILKKDYRAWGICSILSDAIVEYNSGMLKFSFSGTISERIKYPSLYAPINIFIAASFKSSYSVVLYEYLRDYLRYDYVPEMTIECFRKLMSISSGEYKKFSDFKRFIIDVAFNEINEKSDIVFSYKLRKECGNRYAGITFVVRRKNKDEYTNEIINLPQSSETKKIKSLNIDSKRDFYSEALEYCRKNEYRFDDLEDSVKQAVIMNKMIDLQKMSTVPKQPEK